MNGLTNEMMTALAEPFTFSAVQWKPGATTKDKTKALALAYADTRAYVQRLNEVAGAGWSDDYEMSTDGQRVICRLTIAGVTRTDIGEAPANDQNTSTSAAAQAFKRACAKFGLGAYLYNLPQTWVEYDAQRRRFSKSALARLQAITAKSNGAAGPTNGEARAPTNGKDGAFASKGDAITWAMSTGAFEHGQHAANAYEKVKRERQPKTAAEMAELWRADVARRLAENK